MRIWVSLLILLVSFTVFNASAQTVDRRTMEAIRSELANSCKIEIKKRLTPPTSGSSPALVKWIGEMAQSDEYCSCTADRVASAVEPFMLKPAGNSEFMALAKRSGQECILPRLKDTFPSLCIGMIGDMFALAQRNDMPEAKVAQVCSCTSEVIQGLTPNSFEPFIRSTIGDYVEYRKSLTLPPPGDHSLIARMNYCGISTLKP